ncbi:hypothetical protein [Aquabacterium sp. UBA2148]|uniref:hypothetical protein n=1 Tax=Aquabacterium sp. UBA2148 TaxID=1946042 RepID=UPI00257EF03C|nr:hypothetical protein [Aquabacterium sp. UBA2148]
MAEQDLAVEAVQQVLVAYLEPEAARQAAALWQPLSATPAGPPSLAGLSRYCRLVAQQFNLQGREAEIHLQIIRSLQRVASGRPAAPVVAPVAPSHDARVVQVIIHAMERHVERALGPAFLAVRWRQGLAHHVGQSRLSSAEQQRALSWIHAHGANLVGEWPARGVGTRLINAAYVVLAQWLGPVQADACLTRIVRECEQSADASLHRVRTYL